MIGRSFPEYVFIRISVFALRLITPASVIYLATCWYTRFWPISPWLAVYPAAEVAFYLLVYLPRTRLLQKVSVTLCTSYRAMGNQEEVPCGGYHHLEPVLSAFDVQSDLALGLLTTFRAMYSRPKPLTLKFIGHCTPSSVDPRREEISLRQMFCAHQPCRPRSGLVLLLTSSRNQKGQPNRVASLGPVLYQYHGTTR